MFLIDAIEYQARTQPHAVALIHGQRVMRYGEMIAIVRRIAAELVAQGLSPGDVVGITMPNSPQHLLVLLALARMGAVSVAVHPLLTRAQKKVVVDEYQVTAIVSSQPEAEVEGIPWIVTNASWMEAGKDRKVWRRSTESGDLPWRIGLSSGTTGRPKGVLRTQAQTLNLVLLQRTAIDIGPNARYLVLMDVNSTANVMRILRYLLTGSAIVFPGTTRELDSVFDSIRRHGVTHTMVSPDIIGKWVRALPERNLHVPGIQRLAVVGGRLSAPLKQAIIERVTPNIYMNYGTTETGMVTVADPATHQRFPDSVGYVLPWARAQIVDEQDQPVPAGRSGILRFRSIGAADGYYRNPEASAKTFRDGWIYPGDSARLLPGGALVIETRIDDIINVGGGKVDPAGIEDVLARHPDVIEAAVFGATLADGGERLCAAVVLRGALDEPALIEYCRSHIGQHVPRKFIAVSELPRNQMGKVVRHELAARVASESPPAGAPAPAGSGRGKRGGPS